MKELVSLYALRNNRQKHEDCGRNLTFLDGAHFLYILLELHGNLTENSAVLLLHFSSQKGAFWGHVLALRWHGMARRQFWLLFLFRSCKRERFPVYLQCSSMIGRIFYLDPSFFFTFNVIWTTLLMRRWGAEGPCHGRGHGFSSELHHNGASLSICDQRLLCLLEESLRDTGQKWASTHYHFHGEWDLQLPGTLKERYETSGKMHKVQRTPLIHRGVIRVDNKNIIHIRLLFYSSVMIIKNKVWLRAEIWMGGGAHANNFRWAIVRMNWWRSSFNTTT